MFAFFSGVNIVSHMSFKLADFNEKIQIQIRRQLADNVRRVEAHQPKQASAQTLDGCVAKHKSGPCRVVVSFVALLKRTLDDDNLVASIKPLRDSIAASLGIDDGDKRITFQYQQLQTKGCEGVIIRIEIQ